MRSYDPTDESDQKDMAKMNAEPWMVECLALNPEYVHWGPGDDYMPSPGTDRGWGSSVACATWKEFGPWTLDELNEVAHFYFQISRASVKCEACDGSGLNPETHRISEDFYDFAGTGRKWCDNITQDEADALAEDGRIPKGTAADVVNGVNRNPRSGHGGEGVWQHDAINRWILIKARAKRLGVWGHCAACDGDGSIFTEPAGKLGLVLWVLHPRKGASRGVEVESIARDELPAVFKFLAEAADRNAQRFARVVRASAA